VILTLPAIRPIHLAGVLFLAVAGAALIAQIEGERGIAPIASSGDFEVNDIQVDVYGPDADAAQQAGWKLAQRLAWRKLTQQTNGGEGTTLPDGPLDSMVSAIEVQKEQIGPKRYIATLTVLFDRARAGQALGVSGPTMHSPPLLVIPVLTQGGMSSVFEYPSDWRGRGRGSAPPTAPSIMCAPRDRARTRCYSMPARSHGAAATGGGRYSTNMARPTSSCRSPASSACHRTDRSSAISPPAMVPTIISSAASPCASPRPTIFRP